MARSVRLIMRSAGWPLLASTLAAGSLLGMAAPSGWIDWQPDLALAEPWRCWTGAFVHWSPLHLVANLLGLLLVAVLGVAARLPGSAAWAWAAAWPLTQLGWLLRPQLTHFGGLSGVLHAGVAVVVVHLLWRERGAGRGVGLLLGLGLLVKIGLEAPWGPVLRHPQGWDIAVAPWSHACGAAAGVACAVLTGLLAIRHAIGPASATGTGVLHG